MRTNRVVVNVDVGLSMTLACKYFVHTFNERIWIQKINGEITCNTYLA